MRIYRKLRSIVFGVQPIKYINTLKIEKIVNDRSWIVIDIRPRGEYLGYRLWTSVNIPLLSFFKKFETNVNKKNKILLVCRNGFQCGEIFKKMYAKGYDICVLKGGINAVYESEYRSLIFAEKWR